jgi:hypothetical protein
VPGRQFTPGLHAVLAKKVLQQRGLRFGTMQQARYRWYDNGVAFIVVDVGCSVHAEGSPGQVPGFARFAVGLGQLGGGQQEPRNTNTFVVVIAST